MFLFAGMAFARKTRVDVIYRSTVGKSLKLKPGNYRIDVASNTKSPIVKFYNNNGKYVGQAPVKLASLSHKNNATEIQYNAVASNDHVITEISPRGWTENLLFSHSKTKNSTPKK